MKRLSAYLMLAIIAPMACIAAQRDVRFRVVDTESGAPIVQSVVKLSRFAYDVTYENDHPDLLVSSAMSDEQGIVCFDLSQVNDGQYVFHTPGYLFSRFSYSAKPSQHSLPDSLTAHIRVVRLNPKGGPIRGNSMYDLQDGKEYFADVNREVVTNRFDAVLIEMKKTEPGASADVGSAGAPPTPDER